MPVPKLFESRVRGEIERLIGHREIVVDGGANIKTMPSSGHRRLVAEAERRLRRAEPGEGEFADRDELGAAVTGELARGKNDSAEPGGQLLDARREVHRRPDRGEVETVAATDIAVEDLAEMQRQAETQPPF